jgi:hypothetical protein
MGAARPERRSALDVLERAPTVVFTVLVAVTGWWHAVHSNSYGWHYFVTGAKVLFSPAGLHLYARHAELQIGPLTLLVVAPLVHGLSTAAAKQTAWVLMLAAGPVLMHQVWRLVDRPTPGARRAYLFTGLLVMPVWAELAVTWTHPDDVLALLLAVLALRAAHSGHAVWAGLLVALAADAKPWALGIVPVLFILTPAGRVRALAACAGALAVAWAPFYLADPHTADVTHFRIPTAMSSSLRVFGVSEAHTPAWDRPAQLALGVLLAAIAVRRGRWSAVLLLVVVARLLLDPATKLYYDAGLVVGTALCDLVLFAGPIPWLTIAVFGLFYLPSFPLNSLPTQYGWLRTAVLLGLGATALFWPVRRASSAAPLPTLSGPEHALGHQ